MFGGEQREVPEHRVRAAGEYFRLLVTTRPEARPEQVDYRPFEPGAPVVGGNRDVFEMRIDKQAPRPGAKKGKERFPAIFQGERYHRQGRNAESSPDEDGRLVPVIDPVGPTEGADDIQRIADAL